MIRLRIEFSKDGPMRFTSNLDLARAWERLLRRANVPITYSKGFNPQPRLNLAAALPLGYTSQCELVDIWLDEDIDSKELLENLAAAAPPGLTVHNIWQIDLSAKTMQSQLQAIDYQVMLSEPVALQELIDALLLAESLPRERRGKSYDLRPLILGLTQAGPLLLDMRLAASPGQTGRPDEVLLALGLDPLAARVHRRCLIFADAAKTVETSSTPEWTSTGRCESVIP